MDAALRLRVFLAIGSVSATGFAALYGVLGRLPVMAVCILLGVAFGGLGAWGMAGHDPRRLRLAARAVLAVFLLGVVALVQVNRVTGDLGVWFLVVTPLVAGHLIGSRAAVTHSLAAVGTIVVIAVLEHTRIGAPPVGLRSIEQVAAQIGLTLAVCAFAVTARRIADNRAVALAAQAAEVAAARDVALQASRMKSDFLANMSHEIRTPMNGVLGMTELLAATELSAEQRDFVRTVRSSGETLLALINDILDLSKIEAGKMVVETIDFALRATLDDLLALFAERAQSKRLELLGAIAPEVPDALQGDPTRLRQILSNLLANAIKFTAEGEVALGVSRVADRLRFEVSDTGIGIAPEASARLFQAFEQADSSTTRRFGGTGLGLAISKELVRLMGGAMGMESVVGRGSTFWFEVPLRPSAAPVADVLSDDARLQAQLAGRRVLIVDDNATNRRIQRLQLASWGLETDEATGGPEALERLAAAVYDVVLLDMQMPGMSGLDVAREIGARVAPPPKMLLLSSICDLVRKDTAAAAGIAAVMAKPIRQRQLRDALAAALIGSAAAGPAADPASGRSPSTCSAVAGMRVLLAEDNPVNLRVAVRFLQKLGCDIVSAVDGRDAIEQFRTNGPFDVVLMDCHMPVMDGYDATRAIRTLEAEERSGRVPIIALTANAFEEDRTRCFAAGMDDFLAKPYSATQLEAVLGAQRSRRAA